MPRNAHVSDTPIYDRLGGDVAVQRLSSSYVVARRTAGKRLDAIVSGANKPRRAAR